MGNGTLCVKNDISLTPRAMVSPQKSRSENDSNPPRSPVGPTDVVTSCQCKSFAYIFEAYKGIFEWIIDTRWCTYTLSFSFFTTTYLLKRN